MSPSLERAALVAIGGNSLIREGQRGTIPELDNARLVARRIVSLVAKGWRIVVTHGNGPQVGFILLRSELVAQSAPYRGSRSTCASPIPRAGWATSGTRSCRRLAARGLCEAVEAH